MLITQKFKDQKSVAIIPDQVILHSLANGWNFDSGLGWLESADNPLESHYAVRKDGHVVQLVPETMRAEANYKANRRADGHGAISIETDSSVLAIEGWTEEQVDALVELITDICRRHNIPPRLCPAWDQPGIGYHILFGSPGAWTPVAKSCPGPVRIGQVVAVIIPRVAANLRGTSPKPTPTAPATPAPTPKDWYEMPLPQDVQAEIAKIVQREVTDTLQKQGVGLADPDQLTPVVKKAVQEEILSTLSKQGVSLDDATVARIAAAVKA